MTTILTGFQTPRRSARARRVRIVLALMPVGLVVSVFVVAGFGQAVAQSLGYSPFDGSGSQHVSFDAYRVLVDDPAVRASLMLTARLALLATAGAVVLGVGMALLVRRLGRSQRWLVGLLHVNLGVPHLVGALAMLLMLSQSGVASRISYAFGFTSGPASFPALTNDQFGFGILAEYLWKESVFVAIVTLAALHKGVDQLEAAATMLGAGSLRRFRHVTLPLLAPSIGVAAMLVFAYTFGSYEVPYILGQPYPASIAVVALQYYNDTDLTMRPVAMALAVIIALMSVLAIGVMTMLGRLYRWADR